MMGDREGDTEGDLEETKRQHGAIVWLAERKSILTVTEQKWLCEIVW